MKNYYNIITALIVGIPHVVHGKEGTYFPTPTPSLQKKTYQTIEGRSCFRSLDGMIESMKDLAAKYPDLITIEVIGESYVKKNSPSPSDYKNMQYDLPPGYDIYALNVTASNSTRQSSEKGKVLITSGLHAREWAPPELHARYIEMLVEGYEADADITWILEHSEIHAILYANPDGRFISERYPDSFWRKNLNPNGCGNGVDINRNFDFLWGNTNGASSDPCADTYFGPSANSEPETQAVVAYANKLFPEGQRKNDPEKQMDEAYGEEITGMYIDIHSRGGLVVYPWSHENVTSPDDEALQALGRKINYFNGYKLWSGGQPDFRYKATGVATDYLYAVMGVASMAYEIGDRFQEECDSFENVVVPDNLPSFIYAAKIAMKPFKEVKGPDIFELSASHGNGQLSVFAKASDSKMVNSIEGFPGHSSGSQIIQAVHLYLDVHPDDYREGVGNKWDMEATDDEWDTNEETVGLIVETNGLPLSSGRHIVYVQAVDSHGYKGPVSSVFVYIQKSSLRR